MSLFLSIQPSQCHLPSVSAVTIHTVGLHNTPPECFHWRLPFFHDILCPLCESVATPTRSCSPRASKVSKLASSLYIFFFARVSNRVTQNAESFSQVESLDGNFPAALSGDFHYAVLLCVSLYVFMLHMYACVCARWRGLCIILTIQEQQEQYMSYQLWHYKSVDLG